MYCRKYELCKYAAESVIVLKVPLKAWSCKNLNVYSQIYKWLLLHKTACFLKQSTEFSFKNLCVP